MQEERGHTRQPRTQKETVSRCIIWEGQGGIGVIRQHCHCLGERREEACKAQSLSTTESGCPTTAKGWGQSYIIVE